MYPNVSTTNITYQTSPHFSDLKKITYFVHRYAVWILFGEGDSSLLHEKLVGIENLGLEYLFL